ASHADTTQHHVRLLSHDSVWYAFGHWWPDWLREFWQRDVGHRGRRVGSFPHVRRLLQLQRIPAKPSDVQVVACAFLACVCAIDRRYGYALPEDRRVFPCWFRRSLKRSDVVVLRREACVHPEATLQEEEINAGYEDTATRGSRGKREAKKWPTASDVSRALSYCNFESLMQSDYVKHILFSVLFVI
uniref:Uncharacterized protein n=1 Tax=Globisporangium ultimum (strain ATCC 200006 / CBS 805.95 / DAOM BR144) TaxID=431595 RepID=K3WSA1_GLOUD